jgi:F-type H+-transporting ATPase subunit a
VRFLAEGELPFPPKVEDFYLPPLIEGAYPWITKFTLLVWLAVAILIAFFLWANRNPKIVPTKRQWVAESVYGFVRDGVAKDMIGKEGVAFAPYLTTLFCFILLTNLFGIIPLAQISPNAHIAFPLVLTAITYVLYLSVGFRRHGFVGYMKRASILPAPWYVQPLLLPIELATTFLIRPGTLALRLFANMFAGHVILLVFTLGGFLLLEANSVLVKFASIGSWALAIALTLLEAVIAILQAYVFIILTSSYLQHSLAEDH